MHIVDEQVARHTANMVSKLTKGPSQGNLNKVTVDAYKLFNDMMNKDAPMKSAVEMSVEKTLRDREVGKGVKRARREDGTGLFLG